MSEELPLIPKELSWLSFNERVLQEAADRNVPEIERLRYLGIFSNNLDEFFRVRVADVRKLAAFSKGEKKQRYNELLEDIRDKVDELHGHFTRIYLDTLRDLRKRKIYLIDEKQLDEHQDDYVARYFRKTVLPRLSPFLLDENLLLPALNDEEIYFAIRLQLCDGTVRYAIVQIPSNRLPRFVEIPQRKARRQKGSHVFIVLDNIIRHCLPDVFLGIFAIDRAEAYTFKLTRDSELELGDGISQSLVDKVSQSLQKRKKADPVRFIYDDKMPDDLLEALKKRLSIGVVDTLMPGGRYHNSKDFMDFPLIGPKYLQYPQWPPVAVNMAAADNIFEAIRQRDIAMYYPYHSFSVVVRFLKTAAIDPDVRSIHACLYRVAQDSQIVDALINASLNGKQVTVVVELQARFDEANNIRWAERLTEAGARVIFGVPGIKVHAKVLLVSRME
ncbi:MAG TPA: RNA degradosome polyphosphate kinase, partial [Pseudomonadales bacterium]